MSLKVYIGGKLYDKADAKVSVYDHGLLYGDGVFEGIRVYAGKVFRLKEHVDRLFESARAIHLEIPLTREAMVDATVAAVKANDKHEGYVRLVVTRGPGTNSAGERFLTGTAAEVVGVVKCDALLSGTGKPRPITRQLSER